MIRLAALINHHDDSVTEKDDYSFDYVVEHGLWDGSIGFFGL